MQLSYLRFWICCSLFAAVTLQTTLSLAAMPQNEAVYKKLRNQMVEIAVVGAGISDERVLKTMRATPRHEFVPKKIRKTQSYLDAGVPIGESQTIS